MILKKFAQRIILMINLVVDVYPIASELDINFNQSITNNKNRSANEMVYTNLWTKIELIKTICGQLCDTDTTKHKSIRVYDDFHYIPLKKEVDCLNIWNDSIDAVSEFKKPIQKIPKYLKRYFTHDDMVDLKYSYYDEKNYPTLSWNESFVEWCKDVILSFLIVITLNFSN